MLYCDETQLEQTIKDFAQFGQTHKGGISRLSLSDADLAVRGYFCQRCQQLGMTISYDDMGNIYATRAGLSDALPIILGSHLDSVEKGGIYDGTFGVIAALVALETLAAQGIITQHPITIIDYTNEEGARFDPSMMSSGVLAHKFDKQKMLDSTDKSGVRFGDALAASGYLGDISNRITKAAANLELHIEQGPVLESEQKSIGVVEGVVGMVCYQIEITGESDHAGTTPMGMRKDPLFAAAEIITRLRQSLLKLDSALVFTMGRIVAYPNIHTVIPNKVIFTLDARHQDAAVIKQVVETIAALPHDIEGCQLNAQPLWGRDTVEFAPHLIAEVEQSCQKYGYAYRRMYSGAGHDAQFMATIIPTTMIFIPSINGKSHCEEEATSLSDCAQGVNVLIETLLTLDKKLA